MQNITNSSLPDFFKKESGLFYLFGSNTAQNYMPRCA